MSYCQTDNKKHGRNPHIVLVAMKTNALMPNSYCQESTPE